jgi:ATP-binding cassette subfamily F protein 3
MCALQLDSVAFSYGGAQVLSGVTLAVHAGERVALVGPNGVGKTTVLRIAAGELEPESGRVSLGRGLRLAFLRQDQLAADQGTVLDALLEPFRALLERRREITLLEREMAGGSGSAAERYGQLRAEYESAGGDELERRVEKLAADLELGPGDLHRSVRTLSGGERRRLALAQTIAVSPDVLLLDEPTNHLDLDMLERLEAMVASFQGAVLIVSHDRAFLDATCPITVELTPTESNRYPGPYRWYVEERERRFESARRSYERERHEREKQEELIRRTAASGGIYSRQAKARQKRLDRLEPIEAPSNVWSLLGSTHVRPPPAPRSSRVVLRAERLGSRRGGRQLFAGVELELLRGERLGIVGPNGAGKSTLLQALMGQAEEGSVSLGTGVIPGICGQDLEELHPESTPIAEIRSIRPDLSTEAIRSHLGLLRIRGEDQERRNATFSGGERARVALAKLLAVPRNLLALDEPTNNLDIPAREVLEEALAAFEGAVVVVSHDRYFLSRVATRLLYIDGGRVELFWGSYEELRAHLRDQRAARAGAAPAEVLANPDKERRKALHQERRERQRLRERLQRRQRKLEEEISATEVKVGELEGQLGAQADRWQELQKTQAELDRARSTLDALVAEWTSVSEELELAGADDGEPDGDEPPL